MHLRLVSCALLLIVTSALAGDEPIVPVYERGTTDVPSLVAAPRAALQRPQRISDEAKQAVAAIDPAVFDLLPSEERDPCRTVWLSTQIAQRELSVTRVGSLLRCLADASVSLREVEQSLERTTGIAAERLDMRALRVDERSVTFGGRTKVPIAAIAESLDAEAQQCVSEEGVADLRCMALEVVPRLQAYAIVMRNPGALARVDAAARRVAQAAVADDGVAADVASFATSWEAVIINALADQMVVQLRGAAATRLLKLFGTSICDDNIGGANVQSFFPETCNLLITGTFDTSSADAVSQIPGELQRTLRNDTLASLPGFLTAAGTKDPTVAALGPLFVQVLADEAAPLSITAADAATAFCNGVTPQDTHRFRACALHGLLLATATAVTTCNGAIAANCPEVALIIQPLADWKTAFGMSALTAVDLYTKAAALNATYAASKKDREARLALFFEVVGAFGSVDRNQSSALLLLKRWDARSYRWATTALTLYQVAQDFRRGYDPVDLAERVFEQTLCAAPGARGAAYDAGCALKFTALVFTEMRDAVANASADAKLPDKVKLIQDALTAKIAEPGDAELKKWSMQQQLVAKAGEIATESGPEFVTLLTDVTAAGTLAAVKNRTAEQDKQLDALYSRIIDNVFVVWADITAEAVPADDSERAKRLVSNAGVCWRAMREKNYATLANALYSLAIDTGVGKPFPPQVEQYRLLLTNMVAAQDPAAFREAVDSYLSHTAAPDAKFASRSGLWLTGLPGVGFRGAGDDGNAGIFAPVGIDWMLNPGILDGRFRFAVYGQLLDLGNLVSLKYEGDEATSTDVKFRDVWAPGVYLRYPWRSGFSVGVGGAYVPVATGEDGERDLKLRANAFLAYDLSWFRLFGGRPAVDDQSPPPLRRTFGQRVRSIFGRK